MCVCACEYSVLSRAPLNPDSWNTSTPPTEGSVRMIYRLPCQWTYLNVHEKELVQVDQETLKIRG